MLTILLVIAVLMLLGSSYLAPSRSWGYAQRRSGPRRAGLAVLLLSSNVGPSSGMP
jgi:hypothetical protein